MRKLWKSCDFRRGSKRDGESIGLAAIKYGDLSNQASKDYVFDVDRFTSFEGNTGPYILYTIVRIKSIVKKYNELNGEKELFQLLPPVSVSEKKLMLELTKLNEVLEQSIAELAPHKICAYIYDWQISLIVSIMRQRFYQRKISKSRKVICFDFAYTANIETCIDLLGFDAPERM